MTLPGIDSCADAREGIPSEMVMMRRSEVLEVIGVIRTGNARSSYASIGVRPPWRVLRAFFGDRRAYLMSNYINEPTASIASGVPERFAKDLEWHPRVITENAK